MDEQNHLSRGAAFVMTGDPRLSVEHPPLVNSWAAVPLIWEPTVSLPLQHTSWVARSPEMSFWYVFADKFMWDSKLDVARAVFLGRYQIVMLGLLLAAVGWRWADRLWAPGAGLWFFALFLFDPNIISHTRYITTDMGGTFFIFLATIAVVFLWFGRAPVWWRILAAALAIGCAFAAKLSAVIFIPIWIVMAFMPPPLPLAQSRIVPKRLGRLLLLAAAGTASLVVVWCLFNFEWGRFRFIQDEWQRLNTQHVPMPTFWSGIERVALLSGGGRPAFLLGEFSTEGFWYYFPVALVAKTPIVILVSWIGSTVWLIRSGRVRHLLFLWVPISAYMLFTMNSGLNLGYRHLLPILPFIYMVIAGGLQYLPDRHRQWVPIVVVALLIGTTIQIHPHYLSYFNRIYGGPTYGHRVLIDSNIDWGQDLYRLQTWMADNDVESLKLAWFGSADPAYFGLDYEPLPGLPRHFNMWWAVPFDREQPPPGIYAISVSNLWELPLQPEEKTVFAWFRQRPPDDVIGHSIHIYRVE